MLDVTCLTYMIGGVSKVSQAALAFDEELSRLGVTSDEHLARRAARLVAGEAVWRSTLGPMLSSGEVQDLLGISREALRQRVAAGTVLALPTGHPSRRAYPAFQFKGKGTLAGMADVLRAFFADTYGPGPASVSPHTVASWLAGPKAALGGRSPVEVLRAGRDREAVVRLARRAAARVAR